MRFELRVNGKDVRVEANPLDRLLDVLRHALKLTGTKEGCGEGECGACTVLLDGEAVLSCLVPVLQCEGREIMTVEGVAREASARGMLERFVATGGSQCGACTPGIVVTGWRMEQGKGVVGSAGARNAESGSAGAGSAGAGSAGAGSAGAASGGAGDAGAGSDAEKGGAASSGGEVGGAVVGRSGRGAVPGPVDDFGGASDEAEIRRALAGNLCRCTGYEGIFKAFEGTGAGEDPGEGPGEDPDEGTEPGKPGSRSRLRSREAEDGDRSEQE